MQYKIFIECEELYSKNRLKFIKALAENMTKDEDNICHQIAAAHEIKRLLSNRSNKIQNQIKADWNADKTLATDIKSHVRTNYNFIFISLCKKSHFFHFLVTICDIISGKKT